MFYSDATTKLFADERLRGFKNYILQSNCTIFRLNLRLIWVKNVQMPSKKNLL
jgi:hypothetical protein